MLVLTRRINETIKIGDDIEIMVVEVRGDRVRLGFTAPPEVGIWRTEIYEVATTNPKPKAPIIHAQGSSSRKVQMKSGQRLMPSTKRRSKK